MDEETPEQRFWSRVARGAPESCWPWTAGKYKGGYGNFFFEGENQAAHRVAWALTNGPIPRGGIIMHRCDNPPCCNPAHLDLGTQRDNMRDKIAKGRGGWAGHRLTEEMVRLIRAEAAAGRNKGDLARWFGVSIQTVSAVVARRTWRDV